MDSEDGQTFVKNLATFVRTHERALANALHLQLQRSKNGNQQHTAGASKSPAASPSLTRSYNPFSANPANLKPAKLTLTPHHLFYLLSKFEDLGVDIGPMNVRLENLQHDAGISNYVSFMGRAPKSKGKQADTESLRSVSSMRSVVSSMSSLWSNLTLSHATAKAEKQQAQFREDIRYLYSCFTKIPALKLAPDHRARLISGFEEFPFDTAVPLFAFKNVSALEICDIDFRQFHGWDRLAEQLRSLTVKRANVDDPIDLLQHIILDDMEKRRRRSFKTPVPTTPSTPGMPWNNSSPKGRQIDLSRTMSAPSPPSQEQRRPSAYGSPYGGALLRGEPLDGRSAVPQSRQRSSSPSRPISSRQGSLSKPVRTGSAQNRRSSGSSGTSSAQDPTPRHSSTDLVTMNILPSSKWRFLRHLSLAENGMTSLSSASLAPVAGTLQSLDLSGNLFSEVPDALASLTHLRALNLSNCMIDSLKSLSRSPLPAVTVLNLRSNRLLSLAGIERLYSLERIDLRDNKLHDPTELSRLTGIPDIVDLFVQKNPFTRTHSSNYRVTIFNLFRGVPGRGEDVTIDALAPTSAERKGLIDRVPERANIPVIKPPHDDDGEEVGVEVVRSLAEQQQQLQQGFTEAELRDLPIRQAQSHGPTPRGHHRRTISDSGPSSSSSMVTGATSSGAGGRKKKKRPPRRRIVELSQAQAASFSVAEQPAAESHLAREESGDSSAAGPAPDPVDTPVGEQSRIQSSNDLSEAGNVSDGLNSRDVLSQIDSHAQKATIRQVTAEDDDDGDDENENEPLAQHNRSGVSSPQPPPNQKHDSHQSSSQEQPEPVPRKDESERDDESTTLYRQKISALKQDLGDNWLSGLSGSTTARGSENMDVSANMLVDRSENLAVGSDSRIGDGVAAPTKQRERGASPPNVLKGEGRVRNERPSAPTSNAPAQVDPSAPVLAPVQQANKGFAVGVGGRSLG